MIVAGPKNKGATAMKHRLSTSSVLLEEICAQALAMPVYRYRVKNHDALSDAMIRAAYHERVKDATGVNYQGETTWHSAGRLHLDPAYEPLLEVLDAAIALRWQSVGWDRARNPWSVHAMWVNIATPGDLTIEHMHWGHARTAFGCVYYAKVPPGSGSLRARSSDKYCASIGGYSLTEYLPFNVKHWVDIEPEPGEIILFPNWLWHSVTSNRSQGDRIAYTALFRMPVEIVGRENDEKVWRTTDEHPDWRDLVL
jgi:uncharacterized protein (TIGR02466 family)